MAKILAIFLCLHFISALAGVYDIDFDDNDYYNYEDSEDDDGEVDQRSINRVQDGPRRMICLGQRHLECNETLSTLRLEPGVVPDVIYNIHCESCFNRLTRTYEHPATLKKIVTLFENKRGKKNKDCYMPVRSIDVERGCPCKA